MEARSPGADGAPEEERWQRIRRYAAVATVVLTALIVLYGLPLMLGSQARPVSWIAVAGTVLLGMGLVAGGGTTGWPNYLFMGGLAGASWYVRWLESRSIHTLAPMMFALKNQGTELQAEAFRVVAGDHLKMNGECS